MKTIYLMLVIIAIIVLSGCSQNGGIRDVVINPTKLSIKHIETNLTDDFNSLTYPPKCSVKEDCDSSFIDNSCLKCPNAKFVFSKINSCQSKPGFAKTDSSQGLCRQTLGSGYDSFYSGDCMGNTVFCLVEFNGQEIPTDYADESKKFLPIWKEKLIKQSGISERYFKEHFYIHSSDVTTFGSRENRAYFSVRYYFRIDWLNITDYDDIGIINKNEQNNSDNDTIKNIFNINLNNPIYQKGNNIKFSHPINHIISKIDVKNKLNACASGMNYDETRSLILTRDGKITLEAWAEIDSKANKCKSATINLESGEMISCQDTPCVIY